MVQPHALPRPMHMHALSGPGPGLVCHCCKLPYIVTGVIDTSLLCITKFLIEMCGWEGSVAKRSSECI